MHKVKNMQQFSEFNTFQLTVIAWIDGKAVPVPFNFNSMEKLFPTFLAEKIEKKLIEKFGYDVKVPILKLREEKDEDLAFLADFVYKNVFEGYTLKQWGLKPEEIDPTVTARVPVFVGRDDRYFQDAYQGIPVNGYTQMVEKMLSNPLIKIELNTNWSDIRTNIEYERLFFTGTSESFELGKNERYYPIVNKDNQALYDRYIEKAKTLKNVYFLDRLGDYKYYNMDQCALRALELFEEISVYE